MGTEKVVMVIVPAAAAACAGDATAPAATGPDVASAAPGARTTVAVATASAASPAPNERMNDLVIAPIRVAGTADADASLPPRRMNFRRIVPPPT